MLNNKGFAVSAVLYTLLILFLVFLGVSLSMFSASNNLISNGNRDLIDGVMFEVQHVCAGSDASIDYNRLIRIKSKFGTKYWPQDFNTYEDVDESLSKDGKIKAAYTGRNVTAVDEKQVPITFTDDLTWKYQKSCINNDCNYIFPEYIEFSYKAGNTNKVLYDNPYTTGDGKIVLEVMTGFSCGSN